MDFDEYIESQEPESKERAEAWKTAIGLQAVDGLEVSKYLKDTARRHIEGEISIDEVKELVKQYYVSKSRHDDDNDEKEEADKVSANIAKLINERSFTFNAAGFISIHKSIFDGVSKHAGILRDYDITKREWVLDGDTVIYGRWQDLRLALEYDIEQEKKFDYTSLSLGDVIDHLSDFISGIWQIHPFREGNTRTTAVFTIKYLQSLGFDADNLLFEQNSWYFRNALVRANYRNVKKRIGRDKTFLNRFFHNMLMGENNELRNRLMLVNPPSGWSLPENTGQVQDKYRTSTGQVQDMLHTDNPNILKLIKTVGKQTLSVKEIMAEMGLKGRDNFMNLYLEPSITDGFIRLLYPSSPQHPRQRYLLTVKGLSLLNEIE